MREKQNGDQIRGREKKEVRNKNWRKQKKGEIYSPVGLMTDAKLMIQVTHDTIKQLCKVDFLPLSSKRQRIKEFYKRVGCKDEADVIKKTRKVKTVLRTWRERNRKNN